MASEYTKEREERALAQAREWGINLPDWAWDTILAMAKRTAGAEEVARRCDGHVAREAALEAERDALKAKLAEAERLLHAAVDDKSGLLRPHKAVEHAYGFHVKPDTECIVCRGLAERDALKARVAELEAAHQGLADVLKEERRKAVPAPTVAPTREVWEAMLADADQRALFSAPADKAWAFASVPENPAARLVVALRKMLEVRP